MCATEDFVVRVQVGVKPDHIQRLDEADNFWVHLCFHDFVWCHGSARNHFVERCLTS